MFFAVALVAAFQIGSTLPEPLQSAGSGYVACLIYEAIRADNTRMSPEALIAASQKRCEIHHAAYHHIMAVDNTPVKTLPIDDEKWLDEQVERAALKVVASVLTELR
ncbi:hypothetical protein PX699_00190 [Sphingobium sp. H39-3-25]|uniref:hypothetical protein n=1 Tax=Sphingobium arseniciresistens TaxID=3030834 RepID=UPI0023B90C06|nr:hypothetical protein [Sphingobium arseniciresistens]